MNRPERNPRLADLSRACDPNEPADEVTFTPLNEARGSSLFADDVLQNLRETNGKRKWLFSGHVGCGKSSELRHVAHEISRPDMEDKRYLPVFVDIKQYLDLLYITPEAIQLAIVAELADEFRNLKGGGIKLDSADFTKLFSEILNILRTPAESREIEAGIAGFKAKFKYVYKSPSAREKVQAMLRPQSADLLTAINDLFEIAGEKLRAHSKDHNVLPYDDFLIIVDTLDRVLKVPDAPMGLESQERLFLYYAPQFSELNANIIYTVPLPIARSHASRLSDRYSTKPYVLPMVKVCTRDERSDYEPGYAALRELIKRRIGGQDPDEVITTDAFDYLVRYTGGYVREFVASVGEAARKSRGQKITIDVAEAVIADNYANYENSIQKNWLPEMAALRSDPMRSVELEDTSVLEMLESHHILEYRNGLLDSDRKRRNTIWYALHPLVHDSERLENYLKLNSQPALDAPGDATASLTTSLIGELAETTVPALQVSVEIPT